MMIVAAFSRNNATMRSKTSKPPLSKRYNKSQKKKDSVVDGKSQSRTTLVNSTTGFASSAILMMVVCFGSSVVQRAFYSAVCFCASTTLLQYSREKVSYE